MIFNYWQVNHKCSMHELTCNEMIIVYFSSFSSIVFIKCLCVIAKNEKHRVK